MDQRIFFIILIIFLLTNEFYYLITNIIKYGFYLMFLIYIFKIIFPNYLKDNISNYSKDNISNYSKDNISNYSKDNISNIIKNNISNYINIDDISITKIISYFIKLIGYLF